MKLTIRGIIDAYSGGFNVDKLADDIAHATENVTIHVDSPGGSIIEAAKIYNAIKECQFKTTAIVERLAGSAASVVIMACDEIQMSPLAQIFIHNPWIFTEGGAKELRDQATQLDELKESLINAYQLRTRLSRDELRELMDKETSMSAVTAVSKGFADGILYDDGILSGNGQAFMRAAALLVEKAQAAMTANVDVAIWERDEDDKPGHDGDGDGKHDDERGGDSEDGVYRGFEREIAELKQRLEKLELLVDIANSRL